MRSGGCAGASSLLVRPLFRAAAAFLLVVGLCSVAYLARQPVREALRGTALETRLRILKRHLEALAYRPVECRGSAAAGRPVNVVLIAVDTLRADHLRFHRYPRDTSPNLDELARDSLVFQHAIAPAPWTTPSFAGVFTGFHPGALGIAREPLPMPVEIATLTEVLCEAGWQTAGVVSHILVGSRYGFDRGFEEWDETNAAGHAYVSSANVTDVAIRYVDRFQEDSRSFFLFAHYFDPHYDYTPHSQFLFSEGYTGPVRSKTDNIGELQELARSGSMEEGDLRYLRDSYDSEIAFTDHHVGRLLAYLKASGLYDDALVAFLADHGEMFAERSERWIGHTRYLYESLVHVPLLLKLPGREGVGPVAGSVSTVDLAATILDVLQQPSEIPGRSLLRGSESAARPVFSQTRQGASKDAVVEGRWKLIRDRKAPRGELFDIVVDPGELRDLAPEYPQVVDRLERRLIEWLAELERQGRRFSKATHPVLTPEEQERLRSLGYVD
jgi:arylsulfatase A-like enzyme